MRVKTSCIENLCKLVLLCMFMLNTNLAWSLSYSLNLSEDELQNALDKELPFSKKKALYKLSIQKAELDLHENQNRLSLSSEFRFSTLASHPVSGECRLSGRLVYEAKQSSFYLHDVGLNSLHINGLSDNLLAQMSPVIELTLKKLVASRALYTLKEGDIKQKLAKASLESVKVNKSHLQLQFSLF